MEISRRDFRDINMWIHQNHPESWKTAKALVSGSETHCRYTIGGEPLVINLVGDWMDEEGHITVAMGQGIASKLQEAGIPRAVDVNS